jgi:hypothetical protein
MRLGVVIRSVAVLLAAPLLAVPAGGADAPPPPPATARLPQPLAVREARADVVKHAAPAPVPAEEARPIDLRVDCAHDGCVVLQGLDVVVVGP